jgi:hypothetical protein
MINDTIAGNTAYGHGGGMENWGGGGRAPVATLTDVTFSNRGGQNGVTYNYDRVPIVAMLPECRRLSSIGNLFVEQS